MLFQQVVEHGMGMLTWGPPGKRNIPKETPRSCFASHVSAWDGGLKKKMCPNKLWCQHICQNMSTANGWRLSPSGLGSASIMAVSKPSTPARTSGGWTRSMVRRSFAVWRPGPKNYDIVYPLYMYPQMVTTETPNNSRNWHSGPSKASWKVSTVWTPKILDWWLGLTCEAAWSLRSHSLTLYACLAPDVQAEALKLASWWEFRCTGCSQGVAQKRQPSCNESCSLEIHWVSEQVWTRTGQNMSKHHCHVNQFLFLLS